MIHTATGASLTAVSIATRITLNGREREDWHRVALWGVLERALAKTVEPIVRRRGKVFDRGM
jgi:hypothetical protein